MSDIVLHGFRKYPGAIRKLIQEIPRLMYSRSSLRLWHPIIVAPIRDTGKGRLDFGAHRITHRWVTPAQESVYFKPMLLFCNYL